MKLGEESNKTCFVWIKLKIKEHGNAKLLLFTWTCIGIWVNGIELLPDHFDLLNMISYNFLGQNSLFSTVLCLLSIIILKVYNKRIHGI